MIWTVTEAHWKLGRLDSEQVQLYIDHWHADGCQELAVSSIATIYTPHPRELCLRSCVHSKRYGASHECRHKCYSTVNIFQIRSYRYEWDIELFQGREKPPVIGPRILQCAYPVIVDPFLHWLEDN